LLALPGLLASFGGGWLRAPADTWVPRLSATAALSPYPHPSSLPFYFLFFFGSIKALVLDYISAGALIMETGTDEGRRCGTTFGAWFGCGRIFVVSYMPVC